MSISKSFSDGKKSLINKEYNLDGKYKYLIIRYFDYDNNIFPNKIFTVQYF